VAPVATWLEFKWLREQEQKQEIQMSDEQWHVVHSTAFTNTEPDSMVTVVINLTPICPNISNRQFREVIVRARDAAVSLIRQRIEAVERWDPRERERARLYFGKADFDIQKTLAVGLPKLLAAMRELVPERIVRWDSDTNSKLSCAIAPDIGDNAASVCKPDSRKRVIAIYSKFCHISNGELWHESKVKTLIHECTHYVDTFDSEDIAYGDTEAGMKMFALNNPERAIRNADSITGYIATFDRTIIQ
jgi:hypothetical protein